MRTFSEILGGFEALPATDIESLLKNRRPLILAPHPDDESLGCGGLIAAACAAGIPPVVVILTDGSASHPDSATWPPDKLAALRQGEAASATALLDLPAQHLYFFRQRDAALAAEGKAFEKMVRQACMLGKLHGCGLIIGPWAGDPHCDHEAGAKIAATVAARCGWRLLSYPVWGWLRDKNSLFEEDRRGGWRLDITAVLALKQQAIAAHASQYGDLITDSPRGFRLPGDLLAIFDRNFEVFVEG